MSKDKKVKNKKPLRIYDTFRILNIILGRNDDVTVKVSTAFAFEDNVCKEVLDLLYKKYMDSTVSFEEEFFKGPCVLFKNMEKAILRGRQHQVDLLVFYLVSDCVFSANTVTMKTLAKSLYKFSDYIGTLGTAGLQGEDSLNQKMVYLRKHLLYTGHVLEDLSVSYANTNAGGMMSLFCLENNLLGVSAYDRISSDIDEDFNMVIYDTIKERAIKVSAENTNLSLYSLSIPEDYISFVKVDGQPIITSF